MGTGKAVLLAPDKPTIRYHLAATLGKSGNVNEALRELETALNFGKDFEDRPKAIVLHDQLKRF